VRKPIPHRCSESINAPLRMSQGWECAICKRPLDGLIGRALRSLLGREERRTAAAGDGTELPLWEAE
jgi:hypothetical protein